MPFILCKKVTGSTEALWLWCVGVERVTLFCCAQKKGTDLKRQAKDAVQEVWDDWQANGGDQKNGSVVRNTLH